MLKCLLSGKVTEGGQHPSLLGRGFSQHPAPGRAVCLCWLSYRQPWGQGNGGETVSLVWGWSLMVAKTDFAPCKGRASLGPDSKGQNHSWASTVKPVVHTLLGTCLSAGCSYSWPLESLSKVMKNCPCSRQHADILQGFILSVKLLGLWEVLGLLSFWKGRSFFFLDPPRHEVSSDLHCCLKIMTVLLPSTVLSFIANTQV